MAAAKVSVALTLTGSGVDPKAISETLEMTPTESWRLGDRILESTLRREHDGWSYSIRSQASDDLGEQIHELLEKVNPHVDRIRRAIDRFGLDAELACVIYAMDDIPSMHFEYDVISRLAELGAEIDIDLYILEPGTN